MKIYGDLVSGNCLKVKYTADFLDIPYRWEATDIGRWIARCEAHLGLGAWSRVRALPKPCPAQAGWLSYREQVLGESL